VLVLGGANRSHSEESALSGMFQARGFMFSNYWSANTSL